jgi:hypothetical protein
MKMMLCLLVGVLALSLVGCATSVEKNKAAMESPVVVKSKVDDRAEFGAYKTWGWVPLERSAQIDERLDDPEIKEMISESVEKAMFERGYERVDMSMSPHLVMTAHITLNDVDHQYIQEHYNGTYYPEYRTEINGEKLSENWTEGSMLIILFDAKTRQAVWGAGAQAEVFPDLAPDVRRQRIDKIARLLMETLPNPK